MSTFTEQSKAYEKLKITKMTVPVDIQLAIDNLRSNQKLDETTFDQNVEQTKNLTELGSSEIREQFEEISRSATKASLKIKEITEENKDLSQLPDESESKKNLQTSRKLKTIDHYCLDSIL